MNPRGSGLVPGRRSISSIRSLDISAFTPKSAPTCGIRRRASDARSQEVIVADIPYRIALIVGAGPGISASVARGVAAAGLQGGVAARHHRRLAALAAQNCAATIVLACF